MIFYNATTNQGICQEIDRLCDSDDTAYTRLAKTSRVNQAIEKVVGWIINADGTWQFDDSNQTDQPRGTFTLIEGQEAYTFANDYLQIEYIDVKDLNGQWRRLKPLDRNELGDMTPEEYFGLNATGTPEYFDLFTDDSFRLYPAPTSTAVTLTAGGRVTFKRTAVLFTAVSTTATDSTEPGFASPYHSILAYMAAIPFCMTYKKDRVVTYQNEVERMKTDLIKHYSHRDKTQAKVMTMQQINHI